MQDMLTAKQKAAELGISRSTLTRMVQSGKITPAFKADGANGVTLFAPEEVAA
jgi:predicted site-specific integrase-resolvase